MLATYSQIRVLRNLQSKLYSQVTSSRANNKFPNVEMKNLFGFSVFSHGKTVSAEKGGYARKKKKTTLLKRKGKRGMGTRGVKGAKEIG